MSLFSFSKLRHHREQRNLFKKELQQVREIIDATINELDDSVRPYAQEICQAQGKMLRPALVLLTAHATGGVRPDHLRFAALLEMTHIASLIHDDVLDKADTRRDRPTANKLWGNNRAVLLGDLLLAQAMVMGADIGDRKFGYHMALTVRELCEGELEQSARIWDVEMTRSDYYELIRKKTATLFAAATRGAAMLQELDEPQLEQLERIGMLLGISYQIYDDILDLSGKEESAGKTLGTDAIKGKLTLPFFYMLESDDTPIADYIRHCAQQHEQIELAQLRKSSAFRHALEASAQDAKRGNAEARELLSHLAESSAREALYELIAKLDEMIDHCLT